MSTDGGAQSSSPEARPRILDLFDDARKHARPLYVSAPMVRYSKLPFRLLVRDYSTDVTYTPMMLAHEFIRSSVARDSDFATNDLERQPTADGKGHALIAQFASSDPEEFARAAELIAPWVDGVDLNCGCPQSWAIKEGIGCALQDDATLVASMVRRARASLASEKSVSVKIRIHKELPRTASWVKEVEAAGVTYITIHGRTRNQRSSTPPDYVAIAEVKRHVSVPVVANGDAYSLAHVRRIAAEAGADGVMAARGILENPVLFAGFDVVPAECVRKFLGHAVRCPIPFPLALHHVSEMALHVEGFRKKERKVLMECRDLVELMDYVEQRWGFGEREEMMEGEPVIETNGYTDAS